MLQIELSCIIEIGPNLLQPLDTGDDTVLVTVKYAGTDVVRVLGLDERLSVSP